MANTRRMNRLEELGRVDSEKAYTKGGKKIAKRKGGAIKRRGGGIAKRGMGIAK